MSTDHQCGLHRGLQKIYFLQKITGKGYTGESGLHGVGYAGESGLSVVAYTGESLVQHSRPANALKGTVS